MKRPFMLDLFSGLNGASRAMRMRRWTVISLDLDKKFDATVYADVRHLPIRDDVRPDLLWASPPCVEFSRESMPWTRTGKQPSLEFVNCVYALVDRLNPRYWIMENVRGAQPYLGRAEQHFGPVYLWGSFPPIDIEIRNFRKKYSSPELRAEIPYKLSYAVAISIEREMKRRHSIVV